MTRARPRPPRPPAWLTAAVRLHRTILVCIPKKFRTWPIGSARLTTPNWPNTAACSSCRVQRAPQRRLLCVSWPTSLTLTSWSIATAPTLTLPTTTVSERARARPDDADAVLSSSRVTCGALHFVPHSRRNGTCTRPRARSRLPLLRVDSVHLESKSRISPWARALETTHPPRRLAQHVSLPDKACTPFSATAIPRFASRDVSARVDYIRSARKAWFGQRGRQYEPGEQLQARRECGREERLWRRGTACACMPGNFVSGRHRHSVRSHALLPSDYARSDSFNPIAVTIMKKALAKILDRVYSTSGPLPPKQRPSAGTLDVIIAHSNGDIRSALMSLQFLAGNDANGLDLSKVTSLAGGKAQAVSGSKKRKKGDEEPVGSKDRVKKL